MLKKAVVLMIIFIFGLTQAAWALDSLSLEALLIEAKKNNPEILAAQKRWEASVARIKLAKSLEDPTIGVTFEKIPRGTLKFDRTLADDRMFSVNQAFPAFGKLSLKGKIAFVESQMFAADFKDKELQILNLVKNAYFKLYLNYKEYELNEYSLYFLENLSRIAQAKYKIGEISQAEVLRLNSETAAEATLIANLKQERSILEANLNALLNRDIESPLGFPLLDEQAEFSADIRELFKLTLENQPELMIFSYTIEKNKHAKALAKRSYFPDVLAGIVQRGITSGSIGPWDLALSFTVPLWFWTKQRYEIKEAIANIEEARAAYEAMQKKALAQVREFYGKLSVAKNKIRLYRDNSLPVLESSFQSSLAAFRSGEGDFSLLLDTQRMLIKEKMDYYRSIVEYNSSLADLERSVGGTFKRGEK